MKSAVRNETILGYTLLAPALIGLGVFVIVPMIWAFAISFFQWDLLNPPRFINIGNYLELVRDEQFLRSLKQSLVFSLEVIPLLFISSLFLALVLNQRFVRGRPVFRFLYFSPAVVSMVIVSIVWRFILDPSFGFANYLLHWFQIPRQPWLSSVRQALPVIGLVTVWKSVGYYMIIFLAGLQTIPAEYYEAARIDGVSAVQNFRYITFPLLRTTNIFVLVITTIESLRTFTQIYVMTQGGPARSTFVIALDIYRNAFVFQKMGYAASMAVVLFFIILLLSIVERKYVKEGY